MPLLRQTAKKVRIQDLMNGTWVKKEGMVASFVTIPSGEDVARARVLATIVAKFVSEDNQFGSITLDDGSDTIRAKCFKELKLLEKAEVGGLVDLTGKTREYNGEIYILPEIILKVQDPNWELLRRLELLKKHGNAGTPGQPSIGSLPPGNQTEPKLAPSGVSQQAQESQGSQKPAESGEGGNGELRKKILKMIESQPDGMEFSEVIKNAGATEPQVETILNDILSEGICYEPTPGKIKKI